MRILEFLGRFKMSAPVKNIFSLKSFALLYALIQKSYFFVRYSSRKFNGTVVSISLLNEFVCVSSVSVPQREPVLYISFLLKRLAGAPV